MPWLIRPPGQVHRVAGVTEHRLLAAELQARSRISMSRTSLLSLLLITRPPPRVVEADLLVDVEVLVEHLGVLAEVLLLRGADAVLLLDAVEHSRGIWPVAGEAGGIGRKCVTRGSPQPSPSFSVQNNRAREASVVISPSWQMLEEIEFHRLSKLRLEVDEPEELYVIPSSPDGPSLFLYQ